MSDGGFRRAATLGLGLAAGAALVQAAPLLTAVPPLRSLWPTLAGRGDAGHVALTFDDGPDAQSTPLFLAELARLEVRGTFFMLGEMAQRYPDLPRQVADAGHEVAVHSWDHRNHLRHAPGRRTSDQLERTADLLERASGSRPRFFRPPYGALTGADLQAAAGVGLQPVLWTTWGRDWEATATADSVLANVRKGLGPGGTVLLHDSDCTSAPGSWRSALAALPAVVEECAARGLTLGPLAEHGLPARRA